MSGAERRSGGDAAGVTVRYWAAMRAAAGTAEDVVSPGSLAAVLAAVSGRHEASTRFARVLGVCSVLVDEQPVGVRPAAGVAVGPGSVVDLLPPFAGG